MPRATRSATASIATSRPQLINADNSRLRSDLKVLAVTRDGQPEPYSVDDLGSGFKRIKIGDADTFLD